MAKPVGNNNSSNSFFSIFPDKSGWRSIAEKVIYLNPIGLLLLALWNIGNAIIKSLANRTSVEIPNANASYATKAAQNALSAREDAKQAIAKAAEARKAVESAEVKSGFADWRLPSLEVAANYATLYARDAEKFAQDADKATKKAAAARLALWRTKRSSSPTQVPIESKKRRLASILQLEKTIEQKATKFAEIAARGAAENLKFVNKDVAEISRSLLLAKGGQVQECVEEAHSFAMSAQEFIEDGISKCSINDPEINAFFKRARSEAKLAVDKATEAQKNAQAAGSFYVGNNENSAKPLAIQAQTAAKEAMKHAAAAKAWYALAIEFNSNETVSPVEPVGRKANHFAGEAMMAAKAAKRARMIAQEVTAKAAKAKKVLEPAEVGYAPSLWDKVSVVQECAKNAEEFASQAEEFASQAEEFAKIAVEATERATASEAAKKANAAASDANAAANSAAEQRKKVDDALPEITRLRLNAKVNKALALANETFEIVKEAQRYIYGFIRSFKIQDPKILAQFEKALSKAQEAVNKAQEAQRSVSDARNCCENQESAEVHLTRVQAAVKEAMKCAEEAKALYAKATASSQ